MLWLAGAALALSALALAGTAYQARQSVPARIREEHAESRQLVLDLRSEWKRVQGEIDDALEQVETKRKRVAASESRHRNGAPPPPASTAEVRGAVRQSLVQRGLL